MADHRHLAASELLLTAGKAGREFQTSLDRRSRFGLMYDCVLFPSVNCEQAARTLIIEVKPVAVTHTHS
jgi:hypothetical protein